MSNLQTLTDLIKKFRDERNWSKYHTPKNLTESLAIEVAEVMEHFQWKTDNEIKKHLKNNQQEFSHELADVLNYLLLLADASGVDLFKALKEKLKINHRKYPAEKVKDKYVKYTDL